MPRNEHEKHERPRPPGGDAHAGPDTIESRIAHWQRTGENDSAVRQEIHEVMLEQERSLARAHGKQIARDVVESCALIQEKTRTHFDASRRFRPWLRKVLVNRCIDVYRNHDTPPPGIHVQVGFDKQPVQLFLDDELAETLIDKTATIAHAIAKLIADCLKRPYQRLIFSGASGIARFLSLEVLIEWCRDLGRDPAMAEDIQRIAADRTHGRLASLAHILGSREDTVRQNFKRAFTKITEKGAHPLIIQLIKSRRKRGP